MSNASAKCNWLMFLKTGCMMLMFFNVTAQPAKIATYNLLNYPNIDTAMRHPYFREVIQAMNPDILVVGEITSQAGVNSFLNDVMNASGNNYSAGTFIDGYDSDNAIFYRSSMFSFSGNTPIQTDIRDINQFSMTHIASGIPFEIFAVHLKASSGAANEAQRALEIDSLRKVTNTLASGTNFLVCGDFNIYSSSELAYQKLLQDNTTDDGNFIDPVSITGIWNDIAYAQYHTQSPRVSAFGGGSTGGLDDRFDLILYSNTVDSAGGMTYISNTIQAFGNDGNHYNDSVNHFPNTAVSVATANALYYAADHLPVSAIFNFETAFPAELSLFTVHLENRDAVLDWRTEYETSNAGFYILKSSNGLSWDDIGFVAGHGTCNYANDYTFTDKDLLLDGIYYYRLAQIDFDSTINYSQVVSVELKSRTVLDAGIYPNPFSENATIYFTIAKSSNVEIKIYDVLGNEVSEFFNDHAEAGNHPLTFVNDKLSQGIYFCTIITNEMTKTIRLVVEKH